VTVNWPAFIRFHGDDELLYVKSREQWDADPDLHVTRYDDEDRLIDSSGMIYFLKYSAGQSRVEVVDSGEQCSVDDLCTLLKAYFLCLQQCCVPKFYISSYAEGMKMLGSP
jgi:hypothetical protein